MRDDTYYVYIVASRSLTLYIGITSGIELRIAQHKAGHFEGFSKTYHCKRLVYLERFQYVDTAIAREKQLKRWSRSKKLAPHQDPEPCLGQPQRRLGQTH